MMSEANSKFEFSDHIITYKLNNGMYAVYNNLYTIPVFMDENDLIRIKNNYIDAVEKDILSRSIIITSKDNDLAYISNIKDFYNSKCNKYEYVMFMLTRKCNLKCDYCIEKTNTKDFGNYYISKDVIDCFFENVKNKKIQLEKDATIIFYGGEPLLNIGMIKYILDFKNDFPDFKFTIVTNGTLLSEDIIDLFIENKVNIAVSIDGDRTITNSHRKFKKDMS